MTPCNARLAALVRDAMAEHNRTWNSLPVPPRTLSRLFRGKNVTLHTVVRVVDALGYDLVLNLRRKA